MDESPARIVRTFSIALPLPPAALHQHSKGHWQAKSQATSKARKEAFWVAKQSWTGKPLESATVDYGFFVPDRRSRDAANLVGACKAYIDGLVDAGVFVDDCWERLAIGVVSVEVDRDNARVEIVIRQPE